MEQNETHIDRRRFSRIDFDTSTRLVQDGHDWQVRLIDISLNGVLLEEPPHWDGDLQQPFEIIISLGDGRTSIQMKATLVHRQNHRLGMRCDQIDVDSITHLKKLLEINLGDPELVHRQLAALLDY